MENEHENELLVTIIIPAYNVEKYIKKCIESVIAQTYSNIEILVVNDGSSDETYSIIKNFSKADNRIRLINQKNLGVSIARNNGMKKSTGDYLLFVDGDDFIASDYVEYMLGLVKKTKADFCLSKCCFTKSNEKQIKKEKVEVLSSEDATALLLSPEIFVGCWNKIFSRKFLVDNNLWFSSNLFYGEGLNFITMAAQLSRTIGIGNRKVYYYRRNNSISATSIFDITKVYNGERAIDSIQQSLKIDSQKVDTMLILHRCMYYANALVKIRANHVKNQYLQDNNRWIKYLRKNIRKLLHEHDVAPYRKALLLGTCISPWIVSKMDIVRRKRICNESVCDEQ